MRSRLGRLLGTPLVLAVLGAVVGGLLLGLSLSLVSGYVGSQLVALAALAILMAVLLLRPQGLFSQARERRV